MRRRRTRLLGDQLERADAGSWQQIADRYYTASSTARVVAIGDFRVRFMLEPQRFSRQAPTWRCTTKELAHDALVSQHIDHPDHVVNMLTDEQQYSRHADAAAVLLCGRATPL